MALSSDFALLFFKKLNMLIPPIFRKTLGVCETAVLIASATTATITTATISAHAVAVATAVVTLATLRP